MADLTQNRRRGKRFNIFEGETCNSCQQVILNEQGASKITDGRILHYPVCPNTELKIQGHNFSSYNVDEGWE